MRFTHVFLAFTLLLGACQTPIVEEVGPLAVQELRVTAVEPYATSTQILSPLRVTK